MAHSNAGASVAPARGRTERAAPIWQERRMGIALAVGVAALAGVLVGVTLPRGPTTQTQALLVLVAWRDRRRARWPGHALALGDAARATRAHPGA